MPTDATITPPTEVPATPVETPAPPAPLIGGKTDLKGFSRVANVIVEGIDLTVIATGDPQSVWAYRTDGMTCGHCSAVTTDTDLTFCPSCGVGYVIRAFVGIAP